MLTWPFQNPFPVTFVYLFCLDECHTWRTRSGQCCVLPELSRGSLYHSCTRYSPTDYRCSLTADFESDRLTDSCDGKQPFSADDPTVSPPQGYPGGCDNLRATTCPRVTCVLQYSTFNLRLTFLYWGFTRILTTAVILQHVGSRYLRSCFTKLFRVHRSAFLFGHVPW